MPDRWKTYPLEFNGGLITNLSPLQHGAKAPGSARTLRNFEPSIEGGYRRIEGFSKYDSAIVPYYGEPKVHGASQTGTTLILGNIFSAPNDGDTFTITGVTGTYTIANSGVSYDNTNKRVTLTLTAALDSSPADQAAVTFTSGSGTIVGVAAFDDIVVAARNGELYRSIGSGWTKINVPAYGTIAVAGGSQTGSDLDVDGLTSVPQVGDTFTIAGVALIYTVTGAVTVTSGAANITINPALDSSPANDAVVTFLTANRSGGLKHRTERFDFDGTDRIMITDGLNKPLTYDKSAIAIVEDATADVVGATHAVNFKNFMFYGKGTLLTFSAAYDATNFSAADGAGLINVGDPITGLVVFREQLIIFTERTIFRLQGNSFADFQLQPITRDIGCINTDTIQEIGGEVMFLGPDGIRLLGATERNNDFNLAVVSKPIQSEMINFVNRNTSFASVTIRKKSQYRIFGFNDNFTPSASQGVLGSQAQENVMWAELQGFKVYVAHSVYNEGQEVSVFAHTDGYVYQMESGNSFDGEDITATFATPFLPLDDPRIRKTFYKMFLYTDPQGSFTTTASLKYDFNETDVIQPATITLSNTAGAVAAFYGETQYGGGSYGGSIQNLFESQTIGSGYTVSIQFSSTSSHPPFSFDALTLEYATYGRR